MKVRPNQKAKRKPYREAGVFMRGNTIRVVTLHATKGFKEANGENLRGQIASAQSHNAPVAIQRGNTVKVMTPVRSNVPTVRHKRSG